MNKPIDVTPARLRDLALPALDADDDKDARGRVLLVGGCAENPGGLLLAAEAAIRAGAGKLQMATVHAISVAVAIAVPEARVFGHPGKPDGISPRAAQAIAERADRVNGLLIGPGLVDEDAAARLARGILREITKPALVLDAGGLAALREDADAVRHLDGRVVLTPHAGEMAQLLGMERDEVEADPEAAARTAVTRFGAVVALKGPRTIIVGPDGGAAYRYDGGGVGLATSGSGDVLGGIVTGLLARGTDPIRAAVWGVYLHGEAGNALARRTGPVGFLARELAAEVPAIMHRVPDAEG
ncbi:MAG TPA: NAD(P)H-hydrate dehydratase [Longimicrobium sp.]|jgi:hydroxyethylthiazole kinase-like uncharacterized protein yjeF|uniref:NAD(P)H-hydrate dehydratase n=1 Tax=Longimicrobium sp. TaxID=2029185 RepID=UPI002ED8B461